MNLKNINRRKQQIKKMTKFWKQRNPNYENEFRIYLMHKTKQKYFQFETKRSNLK